MNYIRYRWKLFWLQNERKKDVDNYHKQVEKAKKTGDSEMIREIYQSEWVPVSMIDDRVSVLMTEHLSQTAHTYLIAPPEKPISSGAKFNYENEYWDRSQYSGELYLKTKGLFELRKAIRQERKERFEFIAPWFFIVFGLIGAFTGLLSMLRK